MSPRKPDHDEQDQLDEQSSLTRIAILGVQYKQITDQLMAINERIGKLDGRFEAMSGHYVTLERYQVVEKIVFGMVALILVSVVGALVVNH
jgi:hypothetical protein